MLTWSVPSFISLDRLIYLYDEYSHNFTFPKLSLRPKMKWSVHSTTQVIIARWSLWNVLLNKTIPLWKRLLFNKQQCMMMLRYCHCTLRIVMAKTRVTECSPVHQVRLFTLLFFSHHAQMIFSFNWYSYFPTLISRWSLKSHLYNDF